MTVPNPRFWIGEPREAGEPALIPGLLNRHGCLLLTGETNVGKTLIGLEIAHSLLTGELLWGALEPVHTVAQVTYIMGEHDKETLKAQWRLLGLTTPPGFWVMPPPGRALVARGDTLLNNLAAYHAQCEGSGVVIFDPFSAFVAGEHVENDNVLMRAALTAMIQVGTPAPVIVLAHMGKPTYDPKGGTWKQRPSYATRGGSAIEETVTDCFYIEKAPAADQFLLTRQKFKGQAPSYYRLSRDPATLLHTLIAQGPTEAQLSAVRSRAGKRGGRPKKTK